MPIRSVDEGPFNRFQSRFDHIIDPGHFLGRSAFDIPWTTYGPPSNIERTQEAYHIELLVPGFKREELKVTVENGVVIVKGTKSEKVPADESTFVTEEFSVESFERRFRLTTEHSDNRVEASLEDGILRIVFFEKHDPVVSQYKRIPIAE